MAAEKTRILRVIARLNVGGPAIHVALASGLDPARYETRLLAGALGEGEGDMSYVARERGIAVETVPGLGRELKAFGDLTALRHLARVIREWKPHVVHTHTAKAGTLGRLAAIAASPRPKLVHTFHGHVLSGYFGKTKQSVFRGIERALARRTDRLLVPSARLKDELVAMRVGRAEQYAVVPLGFELDPFLAVGPRVAGPLRGELGIPADAVLVGAIGRLTAIKNHALLLDAVARVPAAHLLVVGDGELRDALEERVARVGLSPRVRFAGWRKDLPAVYRELDLVALSSDNEGTPVALIEAFACGRATVSTDVGGVPDLVRDGVDGILVPPRDPERLAAALARLCADAGLREKMGAAAREHADGFRVERLLRDLDALYRGLLA